MDIKAYFLSREYISWDILSLFAVTHFATWGLFMSSLYNFVLTSAHYLDTQRKLPNKEVLFINIVLFMSYLSTVPIDTYMRINDIHSRYYPYLLYLILDLITIAVLFFLDRPKTKKGIIVFRYVILGLICNSLLYISLQIDLITMYEGLRPLEHWWLWDVYTIGVNFFDAMMILVLLIHKDILMLNTLFLNLKRLRSSFNRKLER